STFPTSDANAFMGDLITLDVDLDFRVDTTYLGNVIKNGGNPDWFGKLYRLTTGGGNPNLSMWGIGSGSNRVPTVLLATFPSSGNTEDGPIAAAPTVTMDEASKLWVFFGPARSTRAGLDQPHALKWHRVLHQVHPHRRPLCWIGQWQSLCPLLSHGERVQGGGDRDGDRGHRYHREPLRRARYHRYGLGDGGPYWSSGNRSSPSFQRFRLHGPGYRVYPVQHRHAEPVLRQPGPVLVEPLHLVGQHA